MVLVQAMYPWDQSEHSKNENVLEAARLIESGLPLNLVALQMGARLVRGELVVGGVNFGQTADRGDEDTDPETERRREAFHR